MGILEQAAKRQALSAWKRIPQASRELWSAAQNPDFCGQVSLALLCTAELSVLRLPTPPQVPVGVLLFLSLHSWLSIGAHRGRSLEV